LAVRRPSAAIEALIEANKAQPNDSVTDLARASEMIARFLANGFAVLGDSDSALRWLEIAIDRGFAHQAFLRQHDPLLKPLHCMPEFQRLLDRIEPRVSN